MFFSAYLTRILRICPLFVIDIKKLKLIILKPFSLTNTKGGRMSTVEITLFGLSWLLAAWAFGYWGVERLRASQTLRILSWNSRIAWLQQHRWTACLLIGLRLFQIGFILWQAQVIYNALPWSSLILDFQKFLAILVILLGVRKTIPESLTINAGGEPQSGRWITAWRIRRGYKGVILQSSGQEREGFISTDAMNAMMMDTGLPTVRVGLLPEVACGVVWILNCAALLVSLFVMIAMR